MVRDSFAVFILTHGRPENVLTLATLNRCGYTGKWYMIIDNEDKTADRYYELYGKEHVIMFDKYNPLITNIANRLYKYCSNTGLEMNGNLD